MTAPFPQAACDRDRLELPAFGRNGVGDLTDAIPRRPPSTEVPLSLAQQRLWFLDRLDPGNPVYNIPRSVRLKGPLDVDALAASFSEIGRRHEILRTTFLDVLGQPMQVVSPWAPVDLPVVSLETTPGAERERHAARLTSEETRRPFDLKCGPLWRLRLLRLGPRDHVLVITMHHIISDGWSLGVMFRELSALYRSLAVGVPPSLPELPVQYADYALWQRARMEDALIAGQMDYWQRQLGGSLPALNLPADRVRPAIQTFDGDRITIALPGAVVAGLKALGRREGVTLFMTLLAAFKLLVARHCGADDIVVGTPVAGRNRPETRDLIGFFVNTLVLRTDLSGDPSFLELLARVRDVSLGALANQDVPFDRLVEHLQPARSLSHTPLFQVFFNFLSLGETPLALPGIEAEAHWPIELSKFDVTLYVEEHLDRLDLTLVYNIRLFDKPRMTAALDQLQDLLRQAVADPGRRVSGYSLRSPSTESVLPNPREPLKSRWFGSVHDRFAQRAQDAPERIALIGALGSWTYRQLDTASAGLASQLIAAGIGPGDIVAIGGHRSASLACAALSVLRAGAAFAILDPVHPAGRLLDYLRVVKPRAWIDLDASGSRLAETEREIGIPADRRFVQPSHAMDAERIFGAASTPILARRLEPDDPLCVLFTSGSTGSPKAVCSHHGALSHFLDWHTSTFALDETDRFSMLSGLGHDPLLRDIFTPLWLGATLCVPDPGDMKDPPRLTAWLDQMRISIAHLTPVLGSLIASAAANRSLGLPSLRYAFFGGDALTTDDVRALTRVAPTAECVNFYGTTETPQAMSYFRASDELRSGPGDDVGSTNDIVPLGRGIDNAQLLVVTEHQRLAGVGELGEIVVRSPYLSRAYQDDEALTHERFFDNPWTATSSDRLFRTGDLGRYRYDGVVEFAGRWNSQVKVRGFRVEPAEVEGVLARHPGVLAAAVISPPDPPSRLVAYVVPRNRFGDAGLDRQLRQHARDHLPDYMVPSTFVWLDSIPLTPHGKPDRRALAATEPAAPAAQPRAPSEAGSVEARLALLWEELLGRPVAPDEDFFDAGGHSLLAARLLSRLEQDFAATVPLMAFLRWPTILGLVPLVARKGAPARPRSLVPIQPDGARPPLFLVHGLGGGVMDYAGLARHLGPEQPVFGIGPVDLDGIRDDEYRLEDLAARHVDDLLIFQADRPFLIGGYSYGGLLAFEIARQLEQRHHPVALLALIDSAAPNSGYRRFGWSLPSFRGFAANAPRWAKAFVALEPAVKRGRLKRKVYRLARRAIGFVSGPPNGADRLDDAFGIVPVSDEHRRVLARQLAAMRAYVPRQFGGRLTLLPARVQSLWGSFDSTMGWRAVAAGGVDVTTVGGSHHTLLQEPWVQGVGRELSRAIDRATRERGPELTPGLMHDISARAT